MSSTSIYSSPLCSCVLCRKTVSAKQLTNHYDSSSCRKPTVKGLSFVKLCVHCGVETTNKRHESLCKSNPNKQVPLNQHSYARLNGKVYTTTEETRRKLSEANSTRKHTKDTIAKLKASMSKIAREKPESYSGNYNRGKVKTFVCSNGFKVIGKWEVFFVEACIENKIAIQQPNVGFSYSWNGNRTYYPDFYLPEYDLWVEIKGYKTDRDLAKWDSLRNIHKKKLQVFGGGIDRIRTDIFAIMSCKS